MITIKRDPEAPDEFARFQIFFDEHEIATLVVEQTDEVPALFDVVLFVPIASTDGIYITPLRDPDQTELAVSAKAVLRKPGE